MKYKFTYWHIIFLIVYLPGIMVGAEDKNMPESYLFDHVIIKGTTNVKDFKLTYSENQFNTIHESQDSKEEYLTIRIPVYEIKAESRPMLDDFLHMINAEEHPMINISVSENSIQQLPSLSEIKHSVLVTMNGITNSYSCKSEISNIYHDEWSLKGNLSINLTNFQIDPPNKFLGLIRVRNEVMINFKVLFSKEKKS